MMWNPRTQEQSYNSPLEIYWLQAVKQVLKFMVVADSASADFSCRHFVILVTS